MKALRPRDTTSVILHHSRFYDLVAGPFIRLSDSEILRRAAVDTGDRVLDVGTGPGYLAVAASVLVGLDGQAIGIDASPEMIDRARRNASRAGSRAKFAVASAASLPFDDSDFDVVVSRLVLHHLLGDTKQQALAEIARVLKPGGRLLIADLRSAVARRGHHLVAHILGTHPEVAGTLEQLIAQAGFTQVTSGRLMHGMLSDVSARKAGLDAQE